MANVIITVADGKSERTRVEVDGKVINDVLSVSLFSDDKGNALVTMTVKATKVKGDE